MRALLPMVVAFAACAAGPPDPVEDGEHPIRIAVVGDGVADVVRACTAVSLRAVPPVAERFVDDDSFGAGSERYAGDLAGHAAPDWFEDCLVLVPLRSAERATGLVVSSEEGVDVVTIDVAARKEPAPAAPAILLRVARRSCQLAIVVRDFAAGTERTVGIFDGQ